jgi:RNA polymerase sigma-70 factor (ECF subfamily)
MGETEATVTGIIQTMRLVDRQSRAGPSGKGSEDMTALVVRAKAGSRDSLERLVDRFQEDIFRMAYYRIGSRMDAEDVTQEVFVQVCRNLGRLRDAERFRAWIFSIAVNRVRDFHRKRRVREVLGMMRSRQETDGSPGPASGHGGPLQRVEHQEFLKRLRRFLEGLSRAEREVFQLRFMDQLSIREMADVLKKNQSTIKTHLYRALAKFKKDPYLRDLKGGSCRER